MAAALSNILYERIKALSSMQKLAVSLETFLQSFCSTEVE